MKSKNKFISVAFLNRYSIFFHIILSLILCLVIETISRRSLADALSFAEKHTWAYTYNSFIIFASLTLVYLIRRRALGRMLISFIWLFLGIVNGCILSSRITPFGYTDLNCISDLLSMQNTKYFSASTAIMIVGAVGVFFAFCIIFYFKGPRFSGKVNYILTPLLVALVFIMLPVTTQAAQNRNVIAAYFSNIAQGYENYGFVYGFSSSVVGRGMNKPSDYSEESVTATLNTVSTESTQSNQPNIIVVLLESFVDPSDINFLTYSQDPVPNFHSLEENFSSGYLNVPVVGAGTANTEFEILTGMSMQYFGTGEYPYKTTLKSTDVESIASDLSNIGYGTHVVHNNGGNFYSRANAFSMMGFDTFTSKELMNIVEYTPLGSWSTDQILVDETLKALDSTTGQNDFVYTITVQGHGDYPTEQILTNPSVLVSGAADEASGNQWEYYINMIHEVDQFIGDLTAKLSQRDEETIVVFFGDHIPSLDLQETNLASGSLFQTKYVTWNNFGLTKKDADLAAYELLAGITDQLDIHEGTIFTYEQNHLNQGTTDTTDYLVGLETLQYDLLYGERYAYGGEDLYPASALIMGIDQTTIKSMDTTISSDYITIRGNNFTKSSRVFVNGEKIATTFISSGMLRIQKATVSDGDLVVVNQMGSSDTIFRSTNEYQYEAAYLTNTESSINSGVTDALDSGFTGTIPSITQ
ncbi:MAG: LTA synthase family protein [Lachnospiraceae bacterium]